MPVKSASGSSLPGFWLVAQDATVSGYGDAANLAAPVTAPGGSPVVAAATTPDGGGYWLVRRDGTVTGTGDAGLFGSLAGVNLAQPVVGMATTPDGAGYWLVGADGGIFSFGDASFYGGLAGSHISEPIVGMAATSDGQGYWLVGADGGVFSFGDARFLGSLGADRLNSPIVGVAATTDGSGYWLVGSDGGVFNFGDAAFSGSAARPAHPATAVVGMAATFDGGGYWLAYQDGTVAGFGDAPSMNLTAPSGLSPIVAIAGADRLVPSDYVNWTQQAAGACPGLSWTVLAAIAKVESDFGRSTLPGVTSASNPAGAQGPMQFLPATFAAYSQPTPAGGRNPASPYDPVDSIWAAARLLCADGAGQPATLSQAIFAYNHATWYVNQVEALAASYQLYSPASLAASGRDGAALNIARTQMGVPYIWGGETPGVGFDCSGLVQWAYSAAGIVLPRTSQDQWAALPHLPAGATMQPGDLVFFAGSDGTMTAPGHVGIYIGNGQMLDAPYTGTDIRIDTIDWTDYVGAARPAGPGQ